MICPLSVSSRRLVFMGGTRIRAPNTVISLPSYALFTGSGSLNVSNTSSFHLPTKFSQLPNLRTFIISSPFNVLAVLALHPSLLLLATFIILSKNNWSLLLLCFTLSLKSAPFFFVNLILVSVFFISYSPIPSSITSSSSDSPLCTYNSLSLSFPA